MDPPERGASESGRPRGGASHHAGDWNSRERTRSAARSRARITTEADLDFRGTLGVDRNVPVGIQELRLHFELEGPISEPDAEKRIALTERDRVIAQTWKRPPIVKLTHRRDS